MNITYIRQKNDQPSTKRLLHTALSDIAKIVEAEDVVDNNPLPRIQVKQEDESDSRTRTTLTFHYIDETYEFTSSLSHTKADLEDVRNKTLGEVAESLKDLLETWNREDDDALKQQAGRWDSRAETWSDDIQDPSHYTNYEDGYSRNNAEVQKILPMVKDGKILDYGCGSGDVSVLIRRSLDNPIVAVDISETMIDVYNKRGIENSEGIVGGIDVLADQGKFSLIASRGIVASHTPKHQLIDLLEGLTSALEDEGYMVIDFMQNSHNGEHHNNKTKEVEFTPELFDQLMAAYGLVRISSNGNESSRTVVHTYQKQATV